MLLRFLCNDVAPLLLLLFLDGRKVKHRRFNDRGITEFYVLLRLVYNEVAAPSDVFLWFCFPFLRSAAHICVSVAEAEFQVHLIFLYNVVVEYRCFFLQISWHESDTHAF